MKTEVQRITREIATAQQLNCLLGMLTILNNTARHTDDEQGGRNDGGTRAAVDGTIINVCARLDAIVADTSRWDLQAQIDLEKELSQVYTTHKALMEEQRAALRTMERPCRRHSPTLVLLKDGTWAAVLGDMNKLDHCIIGVGVTPDEAYADFDTTFNTRKEPPITTEAPTTNEQSTLDARGKSKVVPNEEEQLHARRNRKGARKKTRGNQKNVEPHDGSKD